MKRKKTKPPGRAPRVLEDVTLSGEAFGVGGPIVAEILEWLSPDFQSGHRRCKLVPEEWDFRAIRNLDEAQKACEYEYHREAAWAYEYAADFLKAIQGDLGDVWKRKWDCCALLHLLNDLLFPMPWLKLPAECRRGAGKRLGPVFKLSPKTFADHAKQTGWWRAYAIEIDWRRPIGEIKHGLVKLADELRPLELPRLKPPRGKRVGTAFDKLKWLSAWRLHSAGLSYSAAQEFLLKQGAIAPVDGDAKSIAAKTAAEKADPHEVIPCYKTSGAWKSHALDKARALIAEVVKSDPRGCSAN